MKKPKWYFVIITVILLIALFSILKIIASSEKETHIKNEVSRIEISTGIHYKNITLAEDINSVVDELKIIDRQKEKVTMDNVKGYAFIIKLYDQANKKLNQVSIIGDKLISIDDDYYNIKDGNLRERFNHIYNNLKYEEKHYSDKVK